MAFSLREVLSLSASDLELRSERGRKRRPSAAHRRCEHLAGFVREAWRVVEPQTPYVDGWHIETLCEHLEAVTDGTLTRLLINVPPGMMKSLLVAVLWPAWEWGPKGLAGLRYLTASYSEAYARRDARRMRDLVCSPWYRALWPQVQLTRSGEKSLANDAAGWREAMPFTSLTGARADRVILDDPHSTETAESDAERARTTRLFRESVPTRLNDPQRSAIVVIMQRLHAEDVSGQIQRLGLGYDQLILPMEFETARPCKTSLGFVDKRTTEGELLFPERFPEAVVARDKRAMGAFATACQFQQRPAPREGGLFKRGWFEIVDAAPEICRRTRGWDLAASRARPGASPDWTAGVRVARDDAGLFYVEHVARLQGTAAEVVAAIRTCAAQDPPATAVRLPQDPGQAGKAQADALVLELAGYDVRARPATGAKETRARPAAAQAERGHVKIVRGAWNDAFLDELCLFPGGAHDDQVDAFAEALNDLAAPHQRGGAYLELARRELAERPAGQGAAPAFAPGSLEWTESREEP